MNRADAERYRAHIEEAAESLSDEAALLTPEMFKHWRIGMSVVTDERIYYDANDKLYKVVQAHTTQAGWEPDLTPALFTEVAKPGEIPVWRQPTGAQDAYMIGDKVYYPTAEDPVYVNTVDYNTYAPDVYGWELETT